jgi:hypothetical protein
MLTEATGPSARQHSVASLSTLGKKVGEAKTNQWLHALAIKQPGQNEFVKVDPEGCWMPFEIQRFVLEEVQ